MSDTRTLHFDMAPARSAPARAAVRAPRRAEAATAVIQRRARTALTRSVPLARTGARTVALPLLLPVLLVRRVGLVPLALMVTVLLGLAYALLIATVMSYASLTVGFSQSVRDDEAPVAALEARYLSSVMAVTSVDYAALGYAKPTRELFVPKAPVTALR